MARCLKCSCTDRRACKGGCSWAKVNGAEGVCTACIRDAEIVRVIHFQDQGQDFLTWHLDSQGIVVDAQPFQAAIWQGLVVSNPSVRPGGIVRYLHPGEETERTIRYRVVENERVSKKTKKAAPAAKVLR